MRCLIIEDDIETSHLICDSLREVGYTPTALHNDHDGLHHALDQPWDLIIVDRILAVSREGPALVERLRARGNPAPLIGLGSLANWEASGILRRRGAGDCRTGPSGFSELLARIDALARRAGTAIQPSEVHISRRSCDASEESRQSDCQPDRGGSYRSP